MVSLASSITDAPINVREIDSSSNVLKIPTNFRVNTPEFHVTKLDPRSVEFQLTLNHSLLNFRLEGTLRGPIFGTTFGATSRYPAPPLLPNPKYISPGLKNKFFPVFPSFSAEIWGQFKAVQTYQTSLSEFSNSVPALWPTWLKSEKDQEKIEEHINKKFEIYRTFCSQQHSHIVYKPSPSFTTVAPGPGTNSPWVESMKTIIAGLLSSENLGDLTQFSPYYTTKYLLATSIRDYSSLTDSLRNKCNYYSRLINIFSNNTEQSVCLSVITFSVRQGVLHESMLNHYWFIAPESEDYLTVKPYETLGLGQIAASIMWKRYGVKVDSFGFMYYPIQIGDKIIDLKCHPTHSGLSFNYFAALDLGSFHARGLNIFSYSYSLPRWSIGLGTPSGTAREITLSEIQQIPDELLLIWNAAAKSSAPIFDSRTSYFKKKDVVIKNKVRTEVLKTLYDTDFNDVPSGKVDILPDIYSYALKDNLIKIINNSSAVKDISLKDKSIKDLIVLVKGSIKNPPIVSNVQLASDIDNMSILT